MSRISSLRSASTWLAAAATLSFVFISQISPFSLFRFSGTQGRDQLPSRGLHYVVPTTKSTAGFCKLLLSSAVNGYPDPVLIGWGGAAQKEGLKRQGHLFKISEILYYLDSLRPDQDEDLVLLIDAFDVWLQLPPQILIERYFQAIEKQDDRLEDQGILDQSGVDGEPVKNTILFGADKICWPQDPDKGMHCQSSPENSLADDVFGPMTDGGRSMNLRPRFLNSGTAIGPVKDFRRLFKAVLTTIDTEFNEKFLYRTSDQHYIATVWGRQETGRMQLATNSTEDAANDAHREFHMAIDHESDVFMLSKWTQPFTVWMTFNRSSTHASSELQRQILDPSRLDRLHIGPEFDDLPGPFSTAARNDSLPHHLTWADVMLGTNTIIGKAFPAYHVIGLKEALEDWWPQMWFHPYGRGLLQAQRARRVAATAKDTRAEAVVAEVRGIRYTTVHAHRGNRQQNVRARDWRNINGGAWNNLGKYMTWEKLCAVNEAVVFVD